VLLQNERTNDDVIAADVVAAIVVVVGDSVPLLPLTLRLTLRELGGVDNGKLLHVMISGVGKKLS
jgi:hypothetical protein